MSSMAHNYVEYEDMLKSFRCQDLANLLAFANQSKNGKKSELLDRCLNILKKGSAGIQLKIREIHNSRINSSTGNNYSSLMAAVNSSCSSTSNSPDPLFATRYSPNLQPSSSGLGPGGIGGGIPPSGFNGPNQYQYHHNQIGYPMSSLSANSSSNYHPIPFNHHLSNSNSSTANRNGFNSIHANFKVNFEKLAFYEFLYEISAPVKMISTNPNNRTLSYWSNFFLNNDQVNQILETREMISGKLEYSKQIHFRFGFYDNSTQQDNLPPNLILNINGKPAQLPTPKPTSKPNADIIRPGRSIDVTSICKLAPNMANKVELNWTNADPSKAHCFGVYLFRKVSVASLVENLKKNCVKDAEITRKMVREKLQINDDDFEIETTTYKVSLMCPLMKFRIQLPGRSYKCKHVQCFDIESYLMMNEKKPTWNCPVCDQHVPYDDLIIDSLYKEILAKVTDVDEVQFTADGQWSKIQIEKKSSSRNTNKPSNSANNSFTEENELPTNIKTSIKMDEDQHIELVDDTSPEPIRVAPTLPKTSKQADIIDLTLDSDEEQPAPPLPPRSTSTSINTTKTSNLGSSQQNRVLMNQPSRTNGTSSNTNTLLINQNYLNENNMANVDLFDAFNQLLDNPTNATNNIDNRTTNEDNSSSPASIISLSPDSSSRCQTPIPNLNSNSSVTNSANNKNTENSTSGPNSNVTNYGTPPSNSNSSNTSITPSASNRQKATTIDTSNSSSSSLLTNKAQQGSPMDARMRTPSPTKANSVDLNRGSNTPIVGGANTTSMNSKLARDLSMPSPKKISNSVDVGEQLLLQSPFSSNNLARQQSLSSVSSLIENVSRSPRTYQQSFHLDASDARLLNSLFSEPTNTTITKSNNLNNIQNMNKNNEIERRITPNGQQLQSQRKDQPQPSQKFNTQNSLATQQRQNEHGIVKNNNTANINKQIHKKTDYLTKEKAIMIANELKSNNPNSSNTSIHHPNRNHNQNVNNNNNNNYQVKETSLSNKIQNTLRRNSFDSDLPVKQHKPSHPQPAQQQHPPNLNKNQPMNQNSNRPSSNTSTNPIRQPQHQQQQSTNLVQRSTNNLPNSSQFSSSNNINGMKQSPLKPNPIMPSSQSSSSLSHSNKTDSINKPQPTQQNQHHRPAQSTGSQIQPNLLNKPINNMNVVNNSSNPPFFLNKNANNNNMNNQSRAGNINPNTSPTLANNNSNRSQLNYGQHQQQQSHHTLNNNRPAPYLTSNSMGHGFNSSNNSSHTHHQTHSHHNQSIQNR